MEITPRGITAEQTAPTHSKEERVIHTSWDQLGYQNRFDWGIYIFPHWIIHKTFDPPPRNPTRWRHGWWNHSGTSRQVVNIRRPQCIDLNSLGLPPRKWIRWCGAFGQLGSSQIKFFVWMMDRIEREDGLIAAFARCAREPWSRRHIFSSIDVSSLGFGVSLKIGLYYTLLILFFGHHLIFGGSTWPAHHPPIARPFRPSPWAHLGKFRMGGMVEFSRINTRHPLSCLVKSRRWKLGYRRFEQVNTGNTGRVDLL